jgi:hypothetical protein
MTLVVLGIDGLDHELIEDTDATALALETVAPLETFAYTLDRPHTIDVWPTVATGVPPEEHGVSAHGEWDSDVVDFGARIVKTFEDVTGLDFPGHDQLEEAAESTGAGWEPGTVDVPTVFDEPGRHVYNWPGVARNEFLLWAWSIIYEELYAEKITKPEFVDRMEAEAAAKFAWAERMIDTEFTLVATHVHAMDSFSHAFRDDREQLTRQYHWCADHVDRVRDALGPDDDLLIVSDHGMETEWLCEDFTPGDHSWRAVAASTTDSVPETVYDVRAWIEDHLAAYEQRGADLDLPEEQLRDLGYI